MEDSAHHYEADSDYCPAPANCDVCKSFWRAGVQVDLVASFSLSTPPLS